MDGKDTIAQGVPNALANGWVAAWADAIVQLNQGNAVLADGNSENRARMEPPKGQFIGVKDDFIAQAKLFIESLIDPAKSPDHALLILRAIRRLFAKANAHENASSFPTAAYTSLLEFISAKRLWCTGETWILPGGELADLQKPDFFVDGVNPSVEVADHVRVAAAKNPGAVVDNVKDGVTFKLAAYGTRNVRVVIDVSESPAFQNAIDVDDLCRLITEAIMTIEGVHLKRLVRVVIVVPTSTGIGVRVVYHV